MHIRHDGPEQHMQKYAYETTIWADERDNRAGGTGNVQCLYLLEDDEQAQEAPLLEQNGRISAWPQGSHWRSSQP